MYLTTGNSLSNLETPSAVTIYSMYVRLNLFDDAWFEVLDSHNIL
jgi:hypothetical protein